ncbi:MAG: alpha/beta fold hydrolase, partial [Succinivibrio sp.]|nr:alpha/beta fold hydrolase [Succinivibrio sp.]
LLENRQKCHIEHFEDFAKDICFILDKLNITNYKLLAFSLGGLISLDIIKNMPNKPEKAALIAPYIWPYFKLNKTLLKLFVNTLGTLPYTKTMYTPHGKEYKKVPFEINHHSHNQVRYDNYHDYYAKHPAYTIGGPTFKFVKEALRKQLELIKGLFDFTIPVYVQAAGDDKVVSTKESQAYFLSHQHDTIPPKYEIIDNAYHDILNEDDQYRIKCLANALKFLIG